MLVPKISLIIPFYNGKKYLKPCLDSVKNHTLEDFECICINDGSADDTLELIHRHTKDDERFVIIDQKNAGCSEARNAGIKAAKTPYIMFLDQDDLFHPQALETLFYLIETHETDIAHFQFQCINDDFDIKTVSKYDIPSLNPYFTSTPLNDFLKKKIKNDAVVWNRIYKKDIVKDITFPKDIYPTEDTVYCLKVFHRAQSVVYINEALVYYRAGNDTSIIAKKLLKNFIRVNALAAEDLFDYFRSAPLDKKTSNLMDVFISKLIYKGCILNIFRWVKKDSDRQEYIAFAYPIVKRLIAKNLFQISHLNIYRRLKATLFIQKRFKFLGFLK